MGSAAGASGQTSPATVVGGFASPPLSLIDGGGSDAGSAATARAASLAAIGSYDPQVFFGDGDAR